MASCPIESSGMRWLIACGLGLLLLGSGVGGCGGSPKSDQKDDNPPMQSIEEVLAAHTDSLMAIRGVEGVGQALCDDTPCIRIYASERTPEIESEIPDTIEGYAVDVEVTGRIGPRPDQ